MEATTVKNASGDGAEADSVESVIGKQKTFAVGSMYVRACVCVCVCVCVCMYVCMYVQEIAECFKKSPA